MLAYFRSFQRSPVWRVVSIACVAMVFSYICFEVLDLDGSNFPLRYPVDRAAIVPEVETNIARPQPIRLPEAWLDVSGFFCVDQITCAYPRLIENPIPRPFNFSQRCGYRTGLPRSSIPDPLIFSA